LQTDSRAASELLSHVNQTDRRVTRLFIRHDENLAAYDAQDVDDRSREVSNQRVFLLTRADREDGL